MLGFRPSAPSVKKTSFHYENSKVGKCRERCWTFIRLLKDLNMYQCDKLRTDLGVSEQSEAVIMP